MKKIFGIALALVLSVCLICVIAVNADSAVVFTATEASGIAGSEVDVNVNISDNTGFGVLLLEVKFDHTKVQLVSYEKTIELPDDYSDVGTSGTVKKANTTGSIKIKWEADLIEEGVFSTPITFEGTALKLKFQILDTNAVGTEIPVTLLVKDFYMDDMDMTNVESSVVNGKITVTACDHAGNTNPLVETTPATCKEVGKKTATCTVCGGLVSEDIPVDANNHSFGEWTEVTPGNCTTPAKLERVCAHDASHVETKNGEIVANNHSFGEWTEVTPGNCTTPATLKRVCAHDASHVETKEGAIESDDHDWNEWIEVTPGNCTTPATLKRTCKRDANHVETKAGSTVADAHSFGEWTEVTPGNCTTPAKLERVCAHNAAHKETKDGALVPNNHDWSEWTEVTPGNCITPAKLERVCSHDASHVETKDGEIAANNHSFGEWTTVAPTADTEGSKTRVCANDASHVETIILEKLGLTYTDANESVAVTPDDNSFIPKNSKVDVINGFEELSDEQIKNFQKYVKEKVGKEAASFYAYGLVDQTEEAIKINKASMTIKVPSAEGFENVKYYTIALDSGEFTDVTDKVVNGVLTQDVEEYGVVYLVAAGDKVTPEVPGPGETDKNPVNGDNAAVPYILVATMLGAAALLVITKKRANA